MNRLTTIVGDTVRQVAVWSRSRLGSLRRRMARSVNAGAPDHPGAVYKKGDFIGAAYEVFGVLGVGGFSVVYLVYSHESGTVYALKTLRDDLLRDAETREQFRKEAKVWMDLERHPYLVRAHFIEELAGRLYIGMEYVEPNEEGMNTLDAYLSRNPPDLVQTLRWAIQFCHGMEYAHSKGIRCHRDIKPVNIMITRDGIVKITDFGFADVIDTTRAKAILQRSFGWRRASIKHSGFGTPMYMPPEQFNFASLCDERSDVYSFGVVLYQMAAQGRLPFASVMRGQDPTSKAPEVWRAMHRLHTEAQIDPLSSPLFPLIERCLRKEQSARYQTFRDLRRELDELLKRETGEVVEPTTTRELAAWELYNKAFSLSSLGHLGEAIECYQKVLELEPDNTDAWNNKGICYRRLGRNEDALRCYERAIESDPRSAAAWSNKGNSLYTMGRYAEAIVHLNRAIEIDPDNESAWLNRGLVEDRLGLRKEAAASFRMFLELKPVQYAAHVDYVRKRLTELDRP